MPFLLLLAPLLEMQSPGSGLGMASGVMQFQQAQTKKRREESQALLGLLAEVDDDQLETTIGALLDAGLYDPKTVRAMAKASRAFVDPTRRTERKLKELVTGMLGGQEVTLPRGEFERERARAGLETQQFERGQAAGEQQFQRGQRAQVTGELRRTLFELSQHADPRIRAQAVTLSRRLSAGEDPERVLADAAALGEQIGAGAAQAGLGERQRAFRKERLSELDKEVASGVPAARARIIRLAREQGLDPLPYVQRLDQNIRRQQLELQGLAKRARTGDGGGATETQARMKASLMSNYLGGKDIGPRGERVLFGATGEEVVSARDRQILELWRGNIDSFGDTKDAELAKRLKPQVDRIVGDLTRVTPPAAPARPPAVPGRQPTTLTSAVMNAITNDARRGIAWDGPQGVAAGLRANGITNPALIAEARRLYDRARKPGGRRTGEVAPSPVVGVPRPR